MILPVRATGGHPGAQKSNARVFRVATASERRQLAKSEIGLLPFELDGELAAGTYDKIKGDPIGFCLLK